MSNGSGSNPYQSLVDEETPSWTFTSFGQGSREMSWERLYSEGLLVARDRFYIHNRATPPQIDSAQWVLRIHGDGVAKATELSFADVVAMEPVSLLRVIDCGANGRSFFPPSSPEDPDKYEPIGGTLWQLGAAGGAEWTGARFRDVLKAAGIKKKARSAVLTGLDSIGYQHLVPVDKMLEDDSLLVYAFNGKPLPRDHGFPARALFTGWGGNSMVKWLGDVKVSTKNLPIPAIQQKEQLLIGPSYPPKGIPATVNGVKSAFEMPFDAVTTPGPQKLRGRSWSGHGTVVKVEVSVDGGKTWKKARLLEPRVEKFWVRWEYDWEAAAGVYTVMARATDEKGNTQPKPGKVRWNEKGLGYDGIVPYRVRVVGTLATC